MSGSLADIWEALPEGNDAPGWQAMAIRPDAPCPVSAAIRYPEKLEAVMIEVSARAIPASMKLPEGRGFHVLLERRSPGVGGTVLLILQRTESGSKELFAQVAEDALGIAERAASAQDAALGFVDRIVAWKKFMNELREAGMTDAEETGLLGEIVVADLLLDVVGPTAAVSGWVGPEDGLHDFVVGSSAVEVKTTLGSQDVIHVFSLDQLDPSALEVLLLFRVSARIDPLGKTLPEWIDAFMARCAGLDREVEYKLLLSGFSGVNRHQFTRRFSITGVDSYLVGDQFPGLRRSSVSPAISQAAYQLDLRLAKHCQLPLGNALEVVKGVDRVG